MDPDPVTRELYEHALKSPASARSRTGVARLRGSCATPIVGREREWKQLLDCWQSVERGRSHLAVIMGEPGIGKSRLAGELYDWCASRRDSAVARARCYAAQGQLAYAPIAEWLQAKALRAAFSRLPGAQIAELGRVLPEVLSDDPAMPRPLPINESWERRRFFDALHAAFAHAPHPLLLVIDDLQWSDSDTIDYLLTMLRSNEVGSLLVVATMRAEETDRGHPATRLRHALATIGQITEVPLLPLNASELGPSPSRLPATKSPKTI